jgi:hypothetical protein
MSDRKLFLLVSHPRSGSTFAADIIATLKNFSCVMEPFHQDEPVVIGHIKDAFGSNGQAYLANNAQVSGQLNTYCHSQIERYTDDLLALSSTPNLLLKFFPGHLSREGFTRLLNKASGVIFLTRNVVHSYISNEIAKSTTVYAGQDTSAIKPRFNQDGFVWWNNYVCDFMQLAKKIVFAHHKPNISLYYEDLLLSENPQDCIVEQLEYFFDDLQVTPRPIRVNRQDVRMMATDKVANADEMLHFLTVNKLDYLNDVRVSLLRYRHIATLQ